MSLPFSSMTITEKPFATPLFQRAWRQVGELAVACGGLPETLLRDAAGHLRDRDREGWYSEWARAAERLRRAAGDRMAACQTRPDCDNLPAIEAGYLRAALLYRTAGLFLDRTPPDPRRTLAESSSAACFRMAMTLAGSERAAYGPAGTYLLLHGSCSGIAGSGKPPLLILTTETSETAEEGGSRIARYAGLAEAVRRRGWSVLLPLTQAAASACQDTDSLARGATLLSDCLGGPLTVASLAQDENLLRTLTARLVAPDGTVLRETTIRETPGNEGITPLQAGFCAFILGEVHRERKGDS
jgi:hypothetical protein